jgi:hypothetical protein
MQSSSKSKCKTEAFEEEAVEEELAKVQQEIERLHQEQEAITRRQASAQHTEARRQHINRERARLMELQYIIEILQHQEQRQEPPFEQLHHQNNTNLAPSHIQIPHPQYPPPPMHEIHQQPPPQYGTTDPKISLADHLQLAP